MELLERRHATHAHQGADPPDGIPPSADLTPVRQRARELRDKRREVVRQRLSGDSEGFMDSSRQIPGQ